jgi:hypothetical protein
MNLLPDRHNFPWYLHLHPYNKNFHTEVEYADFLAPKKRRFVDNTYTNYTLTDVSYEINQGFRCKKSYDQIDLMTLGCSHTFGMGIPHKHTWGYQLTKKLQLNVDNYCNLGFCGASQEQSMIIASSVIMRHKPKIVAVLAPHCERFMTMKESSLPEGGPTGIFTLAPWSKDIKHVLATLGRNPKKKIEHWFNWISDNDSFTTAKTIMVRHILEQMCYASGSKLLWLEMDTKLRDQTVYDTNHLHRARDLTHCDDYHQNIFAEKFIQILGNDGGY